MRTATHLGAHDDTRTVRGLASAVKGSRWFGTVDRYNGIHDLAHIEVPADEAEYFESVLDADDNVIEYETC